jgi:hypothetical protein
MRDQPWKIFAILGTVVFVLGWAGIIYVIATPDESSPFFAGFRNEIYLMLSLGTSVMASSALLWGVAAFVWVHQSSTVGGGQVEICYDAASWSPPALREILAELTRRDIPFVVERGELVVEKRFESTVDLVAAAYDSAASEE